MNFQKLFQLYIHHEHFHSVAHCISIWLMHTAVGILHIGMHHWSSQSQSIANQQKIPPLCLPCNPHCNAFPELLISHNTSHTTLCLYLCLTSSVSVCLSLFNYVCFSHLWYISVCLTCHQVDVREKASLRPETIKQS